MLNITNSKVTVWQVEDKGNYVQATVSSSKKDKQNDTWINMSWFVRFVGQCKDMASNLQEKDKITITNGIVENTYDKENKKTYINVVVFAFEMAESKPIADMFIEEDDNSDELPF